MSGFAEAERLAFDRLRHLEGAGRSHFYRDDGAARVPTIGIGYTPVVEGRDGRWRLRGDVGQSFRAAGVMLTARHLAALNAIAAAMNRGAAGAADVDRAMADLADIALSDAQQATLAHPVIAQALRYARAAVGTEVFDRLDPPRQAELIVGAYQSPRAVTRAGPDLAVAFRREDWQAAAARWQAIGEALGDPVRYRSGAAILRDPRLQGTVEVAPGDSLSGIARRHDITVAALLSANPHITDPGRIRAGDVLQLPA